MKKPVLIAILIVALLAGGLVTAAYGASPNSPLYAVRTSILGETPEDEVVPPVEEPEWQDQLANLDELEELDQLAELDAFADLDIKDYKSVDPALYTDTLPVDDDDDPTRPGDDEWTYEGEWFEGHFSVMPIPDCTVVETEPNPVLKKLADIYGVTYEEVKGWYCEGRSLPEITMALNISSKTGVPVADLFAKRDAGMTWAEILKELGYTHDDMLTDPILPPGLKDAICLDAEGLAKLKEMAGEYDMPIDEMIAWYCEGNGFEELEKAFSIFKEIGIDMDKILADHDNGLSWEEMMKGYDIGDMPDWPEIDLPSHDEKLDKLPEDMEKVKEAFKDGSLEDLWKNLKDLPIPPWPGDDNP
jgi:uncharacterized protein (DUF433 family)